MLNDSDSTMVWLIASGAEPVRFLFLLLKLDNDAIQALIDFSTDIK